MILNALCCSRQGLSKGIDFASVVDWLEIGGPAFANFFPEL